MYSSPHKTHQLESLKQFLVSSQPLMLVIAEESCGKFSLISKLMTDIQIKQRVIRLQSDENLLPTQLTQLLLQHCGVGMDDTELMYEHQLDRIIQTLAAQNLGSIFIIDDADRLPTATLSALLHISVKQNVYPTKLHMVLLGKTKLIEKLRALQVKSVPQLFLTSIPKIEHAKKQKHWVKAISLSLLFALGFVMWYHKEHNQFPFLHSKTLHNNAMQPLTMTGDLRFVSSEKEPKALATAIPAGKTDATQQKIVVTQTAPQLAYTLQLLGSRHLNMLEHFVAKNNLKETARIMTTVYQSKPWYIITYGHYHTTSQAKIACKQLPSSLQKLHPWVRPTSTIH